MEAKPATSEVVTPVENDKNEVAASSNDEKFNAESKISELVDKKASASDDEDIEEEERSWRRGYDGE